MRLPLSTYKTLKTHFHSIDKIQGHLHLIYTIFAQWGFKTEKIPKYANYIKWKFCGVSDLFMLTKKEVRTTYFK